MSPDTQPLEGTRVLEFAQLFPGPYTGLVLASLGADVVKVEPPTGDPTRMVPPFVEDSGGGAGAVFCALNREKRSVKLDLATETGVEAYHALADTADVVIDGYRPGVADRLGVDYETLAEDREQLVYVHVTGFGPTGELADEPGHDLTYQAWAGAIDPADEALPNLPTADSTSALWAALIATAHLGQGCHKLDASLTGSLAAPTILQNAIAVAGGSPDLLTGRLPGYNTYTCADGQRLAIGALEEHFWMNLCQAVDDPELEPLGHPGNPQDPDEAKKRLADAFGSQDRETWRARLDEHDVPCAPVRSVDEALDAPLGLGSVDPPGVDGLEDLEGAPALGEHTEPVLAEVGLSPPSGA